MRLPRATSGRVTMKMRAVRGDTLTRRLVRMPCSRRAASMMRAAGRGSKKSSTNCATAQAPRTEVVAALPRSRGKSTA